MQMFIWQKDLLSVACYICACMKLHATLQFVYYNYKKNMTQLNPAGVGWCNHYI